MLIWYFASPAFSSPVVQFFHDRLWSYPAPVDNSTFGEYPPALMLTMLSLEADR